MRTTLSGVANGVSEATMDTLGQDIYEVDSHAGARPLCAPYQGKLFSRSNKSGYITDINDKKWRYYPESSTSIGKPAGLFGINCGHHKRGVSDGYFAKSSEETKDFARNDADYRKSQRQRELERRVRASKRECSELGKLGTDSEEYQNAVYTLKQREQALKGYCKDNGLKYKPDRTATAGYGRSEAGKATAAYRKQVEADRAQLKFYGRGSGTGDYHSSKKEHTFEKIGEIDVSDTKALSKSVLDFENKYIDSDVEHCRVITNTGEIFEIHGEKARVDTTLLGEKMRGSINEHNHVNGMSQYSFGKEDLFSSIEDGSSVVIACDDKYRYSMTFPSEKIDDQQAFNAYDEARKKVSERMFLGENIDYENEQSEVIRLTCERLGINYERKRR